MDFKVTFLTDIYHQIALCRLPYCRPDNRRGSSDWFAMKYTVDKERYVLPYSAASNVSREPAVQPPAHG